MNSSRSAKVNVVSNLSAAAEEEKARFPGATKPASGKIVAEVDSEEGESGFAKMIAEDSSEEESGFTKMAAEGCSEGGGRPDRFLAAQIRDARNTKEERARFQVETKPSNKMVAFAKMVEEVDSDKAESACIKMIEEEDLEEFGPNRVSAAQASCFRDTWNRRYSRYFGHFEDTTKIPNMRFTYKKPKPHESPEPTATLQIFSLKVPKIRGGLQWPLHVFGKVAIRDVVDHNRNMIFHRPRESCQILTQEDPYLKLTGPTRAVVVVDPVAFEVDLQVKGVTQDEDESLSFLAVPYNDFTSLKSRHDKMYYASKLSTVGFELGSIVYSVEATISLRVRPGGSWPDGFRARISARTASIGTAEVILLDSVDDGTIHVSCNGIIKLTRCVVSVEITGKLAVCVKAGQGEEIVVDRNKSFKAKNDGASHGILRLGFCSLDVTVAWSLISTSR